MATVKKPCIQLMPSLFVSCQSDLSLLRCGKSGTCNMQLFILVFFGNVIIYVGDTQVNHL